MEQVISDWVLNSPEILAQIGKSALPRLESILDYLVVDGVAVGLAIVLIGVALLYGLYRELFSFATAKKSLNKANKVFSFVDAVTEDAARKNFTKNFTEIDQAMHKNKLLHRGWEEFSETLIRPSGDGADTVIKNTTRPGFFISVDDVIRASGLRGFHVASNVFIAIGLILTFLGLVAALTEASTAIRAGEDFALAIENLLAVAAVKFWTSVAGLLCSVCFRWRYEANHKWFSSRLAQINDRIERGLHFVSSESIACKQLEEIQNIRNSAGQFSASLAVSLSDAITQKMGSVFADALAPIHRSIETLGNNISSGVSEAVSKSAGGEIERLSHGLGAIVESLVQTRQDMDGIGQSMRATIEESATMMRTQQEMMKSIFSEVESQTKRDLDGLGRTLRMSVEDSAGAMKTHIEASLAAFAEMQARNKEEASETGRLLRSSIEDAVGAMRTQQEMMKSTFSEVESQTRRDLDGLGRTLRTSVEDSVCAMKAQIEASLAAFAEVQARNKEEASEAGRLLRSNIEDAVGAMRTQYDAMRASFSEAENQARKGMEGMGNALRTSVEDIIHLAKAQIDSTAAQFSETEKRMAQHAEAMRQLTARSQEAERAMGAASSHLVKATDPIIHSSNLLLQAGNKLTTSFEKAQDAIGRSHQGISKLADKMEQSQTSLAEVWGNYDKRFSNVDANMAKMVESLVGGVSDSIAHIDKFVRDMDEKLGETVNRLAGNIAELIEMSENFEGAADKLLKATTTEKVNGNGMSIPLRLAKPAEVEEAVS